MKKQFFRVKQLADQTFLGADRSEGLNHNELKAADNKVEYISKALTEIYKKLPASLNSSEFVEKRKKKYGEYALGSSMHELVGQTEDNMLLKYVLKECANAEMQLAEEKVVYETEVEQHVGIPINGILEKELPNILKQKKNLSKHVLDKDSAQNRYQNATKNGTQKENLREDLDEADIKVDQSRDALATEMYGLLRRENEICSYFLQLLKMQRCYHESAFKHLQDIIPKLEQRLGDNKIKPIFGCDLAEHLKMTNRQIAYPLELCVLALLELGVSEEGLFRVAGSASRIKRLKLSIDSGCFSLPLIPEYRDVHVLSNALKLYLRELPEPLLTYDLYNEWMDTMKYPEEERLIAIQDVLKKLPQPNYDNLGFLLQFLSKLSKHPENKMTTSNIAIVIAPNLLWTSKSEEINAHMKKCTTVNMIVELLISNFENLFPNDLMCLTTIKKSDLFDGDLFHRPEIQSLRQNHFVDHPHHQQQQENYNETASPRPTLRKAKAKPAPAPPVTKNDADLLVGTQNENARPTSYYNTMTGTASLSRSYKLRASEMPRTKTNNNELDNRRSSLTIDENIMHKVDLPNQPLVNLDANTKVEQKQSQSQIAKPRNNIEQAVELNHQQKSNSIAGDEIMVKPIAAPRTSIMTPESDKVAQTQCVRKDSMSKSLNSIDIDAECIQMRRSSREELERSAKPAIPIRPASLRAPAHRNIDGDAAIHKTQCSVYNTPNKLQPSIVTLSKMAGHDNQIAEKEKFLGHHPRASLENKFSDINSNLDNTSKLTKPEVPLKPPHMKSNEKLDVEPLNEKSNGNPKPSHVRTRSDGNIIEFHNSEGTVTLLQTPPSPRSLNKPSQPPPPPPTTTKTKLEPETTNF